MPTHRVGFALEDGSMRVARCGQNSFRAYVDLWSGRLLVGSSMGIILLEMLKLKARSRHPTRCEEDFPNWLPFSLADRHCLSWPFTNLWFDHLRARANVGRSHFSWSPTLVRIIPTPSSMNLIAPHSKPERLSLPWQMLTRDWIESPANAARQVDRPPKQRFPARDRLRLDERTGKT